MVGAPNRIFKKFALWTFLSFYREELGTLGLYNIAMDREYRISEIAYHFTVCFFLGEKAIFVRTNLEFFLSFLFIMFHHITYTQLLNQ